MLRPPFQFCPDNPTQDAVQHDTPRTVSHVFHRTHFDRSFCFFGVFGVCSCAVSVPLVVTTVLTASCITCKLQGFLMFSVFVVDCLLEAMRWQADASCSRVAAPRTSSWSDESFFPLREEPNHQNTRICWVTVNFLILAVVILLGVTALFHLPCSDFTVLILFSTHFFFFFFFFFFSVFWCIQSRSTRLTFILSLPRIWLSRSTSKIDALDR